MELVRETISILSYFVLPTLIVGFPLYGLIKGVRVY
jgi:spore maturation protein B